MAKNHLIPIAVHLFFTRNNKILLLRRMNTGYEDGKLSVVAGHIEEGETVNMAAIREAFEEAGVRILDEDIIPVGVMQRKSNDERVDFFVAIKNWEGDLKNCEPNKCNELVWVDINSLPEDVIPYVDQAIRNWRSKKWFSIYGW